MKNTPQFSKGTLAGTFETLSQSLWREIPGVYEIDSGKPGPTIGITLHTHGNEPSGLAIFHYFTQIDALVGRILKGKVIFVLNNIEATRKYLQAIDATEQKRYRFVDVNINRLPYDLFSSDNQNYYEVRRVIELIPVWKQFEIALDVHSTTLPCPPMIIAPPYFDRSLIRGIPAQIILSNITLVQIGKPAIGFYGKSEIQRSLFGIETGSHESPESFVCGIASVEALLVNAGVLEKSQETDPVPQMSYSDYFVASSVVFPDTSYSLTRIFGNFERVEKGVILATGTGLNIVMPFDGHTLFCKEHLKPLSLSEEVMFIAKPAVEFVL